MPLGVTAPEPVNDVASNVVDFSVDEGVKSPVPKREICRVVDLVLAREGIERPCMVSVSVVTDERMAQLNHRWRGKDRATDVLSLECERPDDANLAPGEPCELGDVILAPAYVAHRPLALARRPPTSSFSFSCTACCTCWATTTLRTRRQGSWRLVRTSCWPSSELPRPQLT